MRSVVSAVDAAIGVVARDLLQSGVDHRRHAGHRQRRLRDVGGDDDSPSSEVAESARILRGRVERSVQRNKLDVVPRGYLPLLADRLDRSPALPAGSTARCPWSRQHAGRARPQSISPGAYSIVSGCSVPGTSMIGQSAEESRHRLRIERCRHHDDAKIGSRQPGLLRQREAEIGVDAPLVKFVDDDRRDIAQQRIVLKVGGEDALGDDEEARVAGELPLEADVPADFAADASSRVRRRCAAPSRARPPAAAASSSTRPRSTSAGGTRVVFPAPGAAVSTAARVAVQRAR